MKNRKRSVLMRCTGVLLMTGMMVGCSDEKVPEDQNIKIYPDSVSHGVRSSNVQGDTTTHPEVIDTTAAARVVPLSPETGSLEMQGVGPYPGTWRFEDVTATLADRSAAGRTNNILTLEAHKVPPENHFKLYLIRPNGKVEPGTYFIEKSVGNPPYELDASWENNGHNFRALSGAKGSVQLKSLTADRAVGDFEVTLVPLDGGKEETLRGSFDMKVQR